MSKRPSDAAIAAAFWEARRALNETPLWAMSREDSEFMRRGDEIVRNARVAEWHVGLIAEVEGAAP